jgi:hypothetical protein
MEIIFWADLHLERDLGKAMETASKFVKERVENKKVCFKVIRGRIS